MEWVFQHHPEGVTFGGAFVIEKQSFEKRFYSLALSCTNCSDPHHPVEEECALMEWVFQHHPEGVTFGGAFVIEKQSFEKRFYSLALSCTNCSDPHHPVEEECSLMEWVFQHHPLKASLLSVRQELVFEHHAEGASGALKVEFRAC